MSKKAAGFDITPAAAVAMVGVLAGAGFAFYAWRKGGVQPAAQQVGQGIGQAVGGAVVGAGTGLVIGAGQAVGIPATNETACERARREGRTLDASFACDAGTFIRYMLGRDAPAGSKDATGMPLVGPPVNQSILDPRDAMAGRGTGAGINQTPPPPYWDGYMYEGQLWFGAP
jgi:hypothetical protein